MGIKFKTPEFTGLYLSLNDPHIYRGKEKYGCLALFPKGTDFTGFNDALRQSIEAKFPGKSAALLKSKNFKNPLRAQDEKVDDEGNIQRNFTPGAFFLSLSAKEQPMVYNMDRTKATYPLSNQVFYSGAHFVAILDIFTWHQKEDDSKGASCSLIGLQKVANGPRLGGSSVSVSETDFLAVAARDDSLSDVAFDIDVPKKKSNDLDDEIPF